MPPKTKPASPKKAKLAAQPRPTLSEATLPLPAFLKYLTSAARAPLSMQQAMRAAAILVPKGHNSPAKLAKLSLSDLAGLGISDEVVRKQLVALGGPQSKPKRQSDLDRPLPTSSNQAQFAQTDFDFDEICFEVSPSPVAHAATVDLD